VQVESHCDRTTVRLPFKIKQNNSESLLNKSDFSTLYSITKYSDDNNHRMLLPKSSKKDDRNLVSIRFLGITMEKASITPTSVSYYEK
jgi:hypothetical protein